MGVEGNHVSLISEVESRTFQSKNIANVRVILANGSECEPNDVHSCAIRIPIDSQSQSESQSNPNRKGIF